MAAAAPEGPFDPSNPAEVNPDEEEFNRDLWELQVVRDAQGNTTYDSDGEAVTRPALLLVSAVKSDSVDSALILRARAAAIQAFSDSDPGSGVLWRRKRASQYSSPVLRITEDESLSITQRASRLRLLALDTQIETREKAQAATAAANAERKRDRKRAQVQKDYGGVARGGRDSPHDNQGKRGPQPSPPPGNGDAVVAHLPIQ